jgi:hypothetical protein
MSSSRVKECDAKRASAESAVRLLVSAVTQQGVGDTNRVRLQAAWSAERVAATTARNQRDVRGEWNHLERAHILSQPIAVLHVRTHLAMLGAAVRDHDAREILGQAFRVVVAGPGSLTKRYPVGNTGGADVSAFRPMPIPEDLRVILE